MKNKKILTKNKVKNRKNRSNLRKKIMGNITNDEKIKQKLKK